MAFKLLTQILLSIVIYDKHYQKESYFGNPYIELMEFFKKYEPKGEGIRFRMWSGKGCLSYSTTRL